MRVDGPPDTAHSVVLGMPHLSPAGIAETWLLKELGHRHWWLLADAAGMSAPDFRDETGAPIYAAFCAVSLTGCSFDGIGENDTLAIRSEIARISRSQVASRHSLTVADRPVGTVEMVSAFVKRGPSGGNHAALRVPVDRLPPIDTDVGRALAATASALRGGRLPDHLGFDLSASAALGAFAFEPCPSQDFNGAGFLYFASFIAFVDRAEWLHDRALGSQATTVRRDTFFYGNIDPGESIRVVLLDLRREADGAFRHHCRIERSTDGAVLADVFSVKAAAL